MSSPEPVLGIDLGAAKACVAVVAAGEARVVPAVDGQRTVPPLVSFHPDGNVLVGHAAGARRVEDPLNTLVADVRHAAARPAQTRAGAVTVADVASVVLDHVRRQADEVLGIDTRKLVVPVRMACDQSQRHVLTVAAETAGLEAEQVSSALALAHAYGVDRLGDGVTAFVDFGASAFECSLVQVVGGFPRVVAWAGDMHLGGNDLDALVVRAVAEDFWRSHAIDLSADPVATARLWLASERCRRQLSIDAASSFVLEDIVQTPTGGRPTLHANLDRAALLSWAQPVFDRAFARIDEALRSADLLPRQVARVVPVGGVTRTPALRARLEEYFGRSVDTCLDPIEAEALGAAILGERIAERRPALSPAALDPRATVSDGTPAPVRVGRVTTKKQFTAVRPVVAVEFGDSQPQMPKLVEVMASPLALSTVGGYCEELVPSDEPIPVERTRVFSTGRDNQTSVQIGVCQGASRKFADNRNLGAIVLDQLAPRPRNAVKISVTFKIDADGVFLASARDEQTGREQSIRVQLDASARSLPASPS